MNKILEIYEPALRTIVASYANAEGFTLQLAKEYADLAVPCFYLAKICKKAPQQIAQELAQMCNEQKKQLHIQSAEALNGYVNITLPRSIIGDIIIPTSAQSTLSKKIMIEYSSPNANKPQHLGHVRNNLLGMSIVRLLEEQNHSVIKANLVNDKGLGVAKLIYAYQHSLQKEPDKKTDHFVGDLYVQAEKRLKEHPEEESQVRDILRKWEEQDKEVRLIWKKLRDYVMQGYEETYKRLGATFDIIYFESDIFEDAKGMIEEGLKQGVFTQDETGAITAQLEPELPNKVVLRADGTSLYITNDLILAEKKAQENIDMSVYVVGNEQDLYLQQLFAILKKLNVPYAEQCFHLSYGMVNLPEGKMKSREGTVVDADDLMDQMHQFAKEEIMKRSPDLDEAEAASRAEIIALGALKYFMLKTDPKKDMIFNPKESISFEGETGPYIQYACTRISSILSKADEGQADLHLLGEEEWQLAKTLAQWSEIKESAAQQLKPSLIANYCMQLAQQFNEYYHKTPILKAEESICQARLAFIRRIKEVLTEGLKLLTIDVPSKM